MAKFINFQEFKNASAELIDVVKYLSQELSGSLRDLKGGLTKLTFAENFESFEATAIIAAGATVEIRNQLRGNIIPTKRLILRQSGGGLITDGAWDVNYLRLVNTGASSATITVVFLR